ncbi:hypothetical protein MP638_004224 [Amoeboaphelidium occidentale]|nr:hypothetical protein MP638_004224 [Amoeboaphelidium occidentale]
MSQPSPTVAAKSIQIHSGLRGLKSSILRILQKAGVVHGRIERTRSVKGESVAVEFAATPEQMENAMKLLTILCNKNGMTHDPAVDVQLMDFPPLSILQTKQKVMVEDKPVKLRRMHSSGFEMSVTDSALGSAASSVITAALTASTSDGTINLVKLVNAAINQLSPTNYKVVVNTGLTPKEIQISPGTLLYDGVESALGLKEEVVVAMFEEKKEDVEVLTASAMSNSFTGGLSLPFVRVFTSNALQDYTDYVSKFIHEDVESVIVPVDNETPGLPIELLIAQEKTKQVYIEAKTKLAIEIEKTKQVCAEAKTKQVVEEETTKQEQEQTRQLELKLKFLELRAKNEKQASSDEFNLIDKKELAPLQELINTLTGEKAA